MTLPVLYSFRRCPYAMRARLALAYSGVQVEHREVVLKNKPAALLKASAKGTVPVLVVGNTVIDESADIMRWALSQQDPASWLPSQQREAINTLIWQNDHEFKPWLDRYKYADRYPEHPMTYYREQCEAWFATLESSLKQHDGYLLGATATLADWALLPFIRQCAHVDRTWFYTANYPHLQAWLDKLLGSELFASIMHKYQPWEEGTSQE